MRPKPQLRASANRGSKEPLELGQDDVVIEVGFRGKAVRQDDDRVAMHDRSKGWRHRAEDDAPRAIDRRGLARSASTQRHRET